MDIRQLQQFSVLSDELNFHKAARVLNMSQPPLSASIRQMEGELGFALFVRGKQGITLTTEGRTFLLVARQTLQSYEVLRLSGSNIRSGSAGILRIGFVGTATYELAPYFIRNFRKRWPDVQLTLHE